MEQKELDQLAKHFFEKCPTEARNFFNQILEKLQKLEDKIDSIEKKISK